MSIALAIPADLEQAFRQFSRDFARVSARWVEQGEETPDTIAAAREGLREYLSITDDPDAYGVSRAQRLGDVFAFWRALSTSMPAAVVLRGAVPVLSFEVEQRLADRHWGITAPPARVLPEPKPHGCAEPRFSSSHGPGESGNRQHTPVRKGRAWQPR